MITGAFSRRFLHWFGSPLPRSYLSWDSETTGFEPDWDLPLQFGHVLVTDGRIVARREYTLRWTRSPHVDQAWLRDKLAYVQDRVEFDPKLGGRTGRTWQLTYERIDKEGKDPEKVLKYYVDLFKKVRAHNHLFVGQQGWFDADRFTLIAREFLHGETFEFDPDELLDVGTLVKSIQQENPPLPQPDETLKKWARRVNATNVKGVKWNIEHAVRLFGLDQDPEFDYASLHGAGADAYWVHRIYEKIHDGMVAALPSADAVPLEHQPAAERRRNRKAK